ncbi:MAG: hypothetical protein RMI45_08235 [Ignisphaera sp.]|nr:hypothetical protein [Ignisphaera sp.]MDW8086203.1 hypothetical protein [Ignisphaera sp.]
MNSSDNLVEAANTFLCRVSILYIADNYCCKIDVDYIVEEEEFR